MSAATKTLRCAIYTRKSSEEGLEQDFNSLHAQREACEAFIKSQRHEGWSLVTGAYDDGGISGGTMQRPGLLRLLEDIAAGSVDIVVVYKVDRLTRSLADFVRMVELFDSQGVSFVSVTQQFNTTSSMGRLTLNVLLSFAQFEREVTGERIRDKIRASKAKGMFMGGRVPMGYRVEDRKLQIREDEARIVRHMYARYLVLGSLVDLRLELERDGIRGRPKEVANQPRELNGPTLSYGAIYQILRNPVYVGQIRHKKLTHAGQHQPLIDQDLWDRVQHALDDRRNGPTDRRGTRKADEGLLTGKIFDEEGEHLTPSHTIKQGRRYRYYISWRLKTGKDESGWRLPAKMLEENVARSVRDLLADQPALSVHFQSAGIQATSLPRIMATARDAANSMADPDLLKNVVQKVSMNQNGFALVLDLTFLRPAAVATDSAPIAVSHNVSCSMRRRGAGMRLVLHTSSAKPANIDPVLVKTIARAHAWFEDLLAGKVASISELAVREGVSKSYAGDVIKLAFISPGIVDAIIAGQQPAGLVADHMLKATDLPIDWQAQKSRLAFA